MLSKRATVPAMAVHGRARSPTKRCRYTAGMPGGPPRSRRTTAVILGALVLLSLGLGWRLLAGTKSDESADPKSSGATPHADGSGTSGPSSAMGTAEEKLRVKVLDTKPHDPTVFTQGLEISGDRLYESGGLVGKSVIRVSSFPEMNLMTSVTLDPAEFAEGITVMPNGDLIQLTWKDRVAYRRGRDDLAVTDRFDYAEEGWGVCFDGDKSALVTSDGSDRLSFRDPQTFRQTRRGDFLTLRVFQHLRQNLQNLHPPFPFYGRWRAGSWFYC